MWKLLSFSTACLHPVEPSACPLHHNTFPAAAGALAGLANVHFVVRGAATKGTGAGWVGRHLLVVSADFAHELIETIFDVDAGLCRRFEVLAAELSSESLSLCGLLAFTVCSSSLQC